MANFTWEIKRELLSSPPENACCKVSACAAFLRTSGSVLYSKWGKGFEIVTENDLLADYFASLIEGLYGAKMELAEAVTDPKKSRDKLTFSYRGERSEQILQETGIIRQEEGGFALQYGISPYLIENECCALAFLKGAFLGGGSCTIPKSGSKTGYHLEFNLSSELLAEDFCELLERFEVIGKIVERGEHWVVYAKSRDQLSDFLSLIGANNALKKLISVSEAREESNRENRANNCFVGNCDKTAQASAEQIKAIQKIAEKAGLDTLDFPLYQLAQARREYPMDALSTLAKRLGVSKSCLNHRMRKLMEIAEGLS